jgi:hypothetical protein
MKSIALQGGDRIVLYEWDDTTPPNQKNLAMLDRNGHVLWWAEPIDDSIYTDISCNEYGDLIAFSFAGWRARIDQASGKVLAREFLK